VSTAGNNSFRVGNVVEQKHDTKMHRDTKYLSHHNEEEESGDGVTGKAHGVVLREKRRILSTVLGQALPTMGELTYSRTEQQLQDDRQGKRGASEQHLPIFSTDKGPSKGGTREFRTRSLTREGAATAGGQEENTGGIKYSLYARNKH